MDVIRSLYRWCAFKWLQAPSQQPRSTRGHCKSSPCPIRPPRSGLSASKAAAATHAFVHFSCSPSKAIHFSCSPSKARCRHHASAGFRHPSDSFGSSYPIRNDASCASAKLSACPEHSRRRDMDRGLVCSKLLRACATVRISLHASRAARSASTPLALPCSAAAQCDAAAAAP